jgi:glycerol-3-phosphate dehydrogenase
MRRDLPALSDKMFDLLVVGAGIHGAAIAWDASLRGLSVALVDQGDFGAATSARSLRIVHGGLRYLVRGDLPRMVESILERSNLLRIAPELVEPLPVLVGTYRGIQGRGVVGLGLLLNDLVSFRRNRRLPPEQWIQRGRLVSRQESLELFPWFPRRRLTGGALWYDAKLRHPERLTLAFVRSAAERGAVVANYARIDRILVHGGQTEGGLATDLDRGTQLEIRARAVVVAAGPWTGSLIADTLNPGPGAAAPRALALNVLISRQLSTVAVGVQARTGPEEDRVFGGNRFLFAVPQDGKSLLGTWYTVADGSSATLTPEEGARLLVEEFNQACPGLELSLRDVLDCQWGWLPLKQGNTRALAERPRIVDHGRAGSARHLFSVEGVKYTTARRVAEQIVDRVFRDMGRPAPPCRTSRTPLMLSDYDRRLPAPDNIKPEDVHHAVHQEMALKLSDIVFRRTSLGSSPLSRATVATAAAWAGAELGWDALRREAEIEDVMHQHGVLRASEEPVG